MLTANNSGNSNVTTPTMTGGTNPASGSYFARFLFRPNTLSSTSGVNIATLHRAPPSGRRCSSGSTGTTRQFRVVNGTTPSAAWVNLPGTFASTTVYTVRLTWSGAGTGSASVDVSNGAATATSAVTGGGSGATVNNAVLGTSSGTVTGQAYFDYYTASRFGMPN